MWITCYWSLSVAKYQWNMFRSLYFLFIFYLLLTVWCQQGLLWEHTWRSKNRRFGKIPESRTKTAGDRNIFIALKECHAAQPLKSILSYSDMWSLNIFESFKKIDRQREVKVPLVKSRNSLCLQRKMWVPHIRTKTVYICKRLTLKKYPTTHSISHITIYNKRKHNHHYRNIKHYL